MKNKILLKSLAGLCALAAVACGGGPGPQGSVAVYLDESQPIEKRVEDALSRMTLEEKVAILHAQSKFSSAGVPRLGIPEVWCTDGPHGIRPEVLWDEWDQAGWTNDSCTAFPALTCLAATWNPEMSALYGKSIGEEARYREKDILLGPGVNIYRTPLNGRNFEYMGEDPYLSSRMVVPYIEEVQKNGVAACVKHFALNNQEAHRHGIDVEVDDRALNEIYLPAFKAAVQEGGAWAVMGAYNKYKGEHCCHNRYLLNDILKRDWAFDGVVVSDWGGTHDTKQAAENGLDMEFGSWTDGLSWGASNAYDNYYLAAPYLDMLRKGEASTATLDDKARRLSDEASQIAGSIGMLASASMGEGTRGLYEPIHGSAPDIAGKNLANPLATILSAAMMLRYSLNEPVAADAIEKAVESVLNDGCRTADIFTDGCKRLGTVEMGDAVVSALA